MRNTLILAIVLAVCMPLAAQVKVAFVNVDSLLQNCNSCRDAEQTYQSSIEQWDAELQGMADELETLQGQLDMPLSETRKAELQASFDEKKAAFEQRQVQIYGQEGAAMKLNFELMMPLLDHIQKSMEKYAADNAIQIIFDGDTGEILYMSPTLEPTDATNTILDVVNSMPLEQE